MATTTTAAPVGEAPETEEGMARVTITMPTSLHQQLRERARRRGITVTELMRRAVALDRIVTEDGKNRSVILRDQETGNETLIELY